MSDNKLNWSVDRIKFEIEELDKVYQHLDNDFQERVNDRISFQEECRNTDSLDRDTTQQTIISNIFNDYNRSISEIQEKIKSNRSAREELVSILRNKL